MKKPPAIAAICALFFLSGASGLVYEVIWVRQFGLVFGNSVYSAALVTALFMCGLGLGAYVAGVWADRRTVGSPRRALSAYGWFEVLIGAYGLGLALLLPSLVDFSATLSYSVDARGWHQLASGASAARYVAGFVLLAPMTCLMGGTLTLLIRYLVANDLAQAGWRIGALYGFNTLGAAMGCFMADFTLIPTWGLFGTQLIAVAVNLGVGAAAIVLSRRAEAVASGTPSPESAPSRPQTGSARPVASLCVVILLSGFAGMGLEIAWFRLLISTIGAYRSSFSVLLTVVLLGIWGGSLAGGAAHRRWKRPALTLAIVQTLFVVTTLLLLFRFDRAELGRFYMATFNELGDEHETLPLALQYWGMFRMALSLIGAPAFFLGFAFPLANACVQQLSARVGARAGILYGANTVGSVIGAVAVGFILLPAFGVQRTVVILASCAAVAVVPLYLSAQWEDADRPGWRRRRSAFGVCGAVSLGAVALFAFALPGDYLLTHNMPPLPKGVRIVAVSEGNPETIVVAEDAAGLRSLWTNGHLMADATTQSQRYMRSFAHIPLLQIEQPKSVLVICFGVGNTAHAASLHPSVESVEIADYSAHVLQHASFFDATNHDILRHPRVRVFVNDGRQHLRMMAPGRYDLVTLEPPPISFAGVSALYSRQFYALAKTRLKPGGFVTQWLPIQQVHGETALAMVRAFVEVFPSSVLLSGARRNLILMGRNGPSAELDIAKVIQHIAERPAVERDLRSIRMGNPVELVGTFVADADVMRQATERVLPVTDDRPSMEYSIVSQFAVIHLPRALFQTGRVDSWCPSCFDGNAPVAPLHGLRTYLELLQQFYESERFLKKLSHYRWPLVMELPMNHEARHDDAIRRSPYLASLLDKRR